MKNLLAVLLMLSVSSCAIKGQSNNESIAILYHQFLDSKGNATMTTPKKIWCKDGNAIEEIIKMVINTDTNRNTTIRKEVLCYLFIDRSSNSFFEYGNLSDTAKLLRAYNQPDSAMINGGWNYYYKRKIDFVGKPEKLTDTVIENVVYQRVKFNRDIGKGRFCSICCMHCNGNGKFSIYAFGDSILPCPVERIYNYDHDCSIARTLMKIEYIADRFPESITAVFEKWERYAKEHPVQ